MRLQFRITALVAVNYLTAVYVARTVGATLFLFLFQPVLILVAGKLLNSAIPKAIRRASRDNYQRLDGTISDRRRDLEKDESRNLQLKIYSLLSIVTLVLNLSVLAIQSFSEFLDPRFSVISPMTICVVAVGLFEFMRRCYRNIIREYVEQIGERHMEYVQLDLDRANQLEDQQAMKLELMSPQVASSMTGRVG